VYSYTSENNFGPSNQITVPTGYRTITTAGPLDMFSAGNNLYKNKIHYRQNAQQISKKFQCEICLYMVRKMYYTKIFVQVTD